MDRIPGKKVTVRKGETIELVDKIGEVVHVHGYVDRHPIIGLNDKEQIQNKELAEDRKFCRYIIKPTINSLIRQQFDQKATEIISSSNIICIYGMSLGATDKKWWDFILRWLKDGTNRQLVIFDYDDEYTSSTHFDLIEKEDDIIEKLNNYCNAGNVDAFTFRSRIHIAIHKNIIKQDVFD